MKQRPQGWMTLLGLSMLMCSACGQGTVGTDGSVATVASVDDEESWDVYYLGGAKAGYGKTTVRTFTESDRPLVRIDQMAAILVRRFDQKTEQKMRSTSIETPEGDVVRFETETAMGTKPAVISGRVEGTTLVVNESGRERILPWDPSTKGFLGAEQSLRLRPLAPNERRTFKQLIPGFNRVAQIELVARDYEATELLTGPQELLRIDEVVRFPEANASPIESAVWVDRQGRVLKTRMGQMEVYRCSAETALSRAAATADFGEGLVAKLAQPLSDARQTSEVVYRVSLKDADPAKLFWSGETQSIKSIGPRAAEITVRAIRAGSKPRSPGAPPTKDERTPNDAIQSDDPLVVSMAKEAAAGTKSPREKAIALEKFVNRSVTKKNFSQAFATAAEVARSREGDCTEHAVLLAALSRAVDMPSRVAVGLVYFPPSQGFAYHMWTEVYVDDAWLPLDATLGAGGIAADHLKLTDSSLNGPAALTSMLSVVQIMGQLKIEVLKVVTD